MYSTPEYVFLLLFHHDRRRLPKLTDPLECRVGSVLRDMDGRIAVSARGASASWAGQGGAYARTGPGCGARRDQGWQRRCSGQQLGAEAVESRLGERQNWQQRMAELGRFGEGWAGALRRPAHALEVRGIRQSTPAITWRRGAQGRTPWRIEGSNLGRCDDGREEEQENVRQPSRCTISTSSI